MEAGEVRPSGDPQSLPCLSCLGTCLASEVQYCPAISEFSYSQGPQGWTGPVLSLPDVFIADLPYFLPSIGWDGLVQRTPCANQKEGQIPLFALSPTMPGRSGWLNPWPGGKPAGLRLGPQKVGEGAEEAQAGEKGWPPPGDRDWDS